MSRLRTLSPYLLAALLVGAGSLHFLKPQPYDGIIPSFLPHPRFWTYASGLAELAYAATVAVPRTRERGALATAGLFVAVFPANVQMAVHPGSVPPLLAYARLPLQIPLVLWALQVRAQSRARSASVARPSSTSGPIRSS
jgi:uncharacterized membrane protein